MKLNYLVLLMYSQLTHDLCNIRKIRVSIYRRSAREFDMEGIWTGSPKALDMDNGRGKRPKIHWEWVRAGLEEEMGCQTGHAARREAGTRRGGGAAINIRLGHYLAFFPGFL